MNTQMDSISVSLFLVLCLMSGSWSGVSAQSGCTTALTSLAPCLNYVTGNSSTPSSSCCSQLASVVQSSPICLCSLLNGTGPSFGLTINQTQALQLPGACNVKTPPISQCNAASAPTTSAATPTTSPAASPSTSPAASPSVESSGETPDESVSPSQGGSKALPSPPASASSGVGSIKVIMSLPFVLSLFLIGRSNGFTD